MRYVVATILVLLLLVPVSADPPLTKRKAQIQREVSEVADVVMVDGESVRVGFVSERELSAFEPLLESRYGESVEVMRVRFEQTSRKVENPPLKAGVRLLSPAGPGSFFACTAGFQGKKRGKNYVITAGHCGQKGSEWFQQKRGVGEMKKNAYQNGSSADAALIKISRSEVSHKLYASNKRIKSVKEVAARVPEVSDKVCFSGWRSGTECGRVTVEEASVSYSDAQITKQVFASFSPSSGDSGSPVWRKTPTGVVAVGIISGSVHWEDGRKDGIFSSIQKVSKKLRVKIKTKR